MTSKEALERLYLGLDDHDTLAKCYDLLFKDLYLIEKLEKENIELLVNKNVAQGVAIKFKEENEKYKNAIDILKDNVCAYQYNENEFGLVIASYDGAVPITQQEYELLKEVLE